MDSCLGRGHPLSEHELLRIFQLRSVLLLWATQQISQGLVTFTSPWAMCLDISFWFWERWRNWAQSTLRLILTDTLTEVRVVARTISATKCRRALKAATHYLNTPSGPCEEAVLPSSLACSDQGCEWPTDVKWPVNWPGHLSNVTKSDPYINSIIGVNVTNVTHIQI